MKVDEYLELHPEDQIYLTCLSGKANHAAMIEVSTPYHLSGPFGDKYGLLTLRDCSTWPTTLHTIAELNKLEKGTYEIDYSDCTWHISDPSVEKPWRLKLYGTDDASWSACFATEAEALSYFNDVLEFQPLTVQEIIDHCGMVFTN